MQILLKPALLALNSLKYAYKFILIGVLILGSLSFPLYYLVTDLNKGQDLAKRENTGVEYNRGLFSFMSAIDEHRKLTLSKGQMQATEDRIDQTIAQMDELDRKLGTSLKSSEGWKKLKQHWTEIKTTSADFLPAQIVNEENFLMDEATDLAAHVGDTSKLIIDQNLDSHYLIEATIDSLPQLLKSIGNMRDQGIRMGDKKDLSRDELTDITGKAAAIKSSTADISSGYATISEQNPDLKQELDPAYQQFFESMDRFQFELNERYITYGTVTGTYDQLADSAQKAIQAILDLHKVDTDQLSSLLQQSQSHYLRVKLEVGSAVSILTLLVCYMFIGFYSSIMRAIRSLVHSTTEVSKGRLQTQMQATTKDEMRAAAESFNHMVNEMRTLLGASARNAVHATDASVRLADIAKQSSESNASLTASIQETAQGTEMQLQGTIDSATAIGEMAVGIGRIAETTGNVLQVSLDSADQAEEGKLALDRVVNQMGAIQESVDGTASSIDQLSGVSQQVGQMAGFIKSIAYKSNILALNASIEAVRAGANGKGFVVVADEMRKLAEMSGSSADGIAEALNQIQKTSEQSLLAMTHARQEVQLGSQSVQDAGRTFQLILSSTRSIAGQMQEISAAAQQLSASSEQVSATIQQIAGIAKGSSEQMDRMIGMSSGNLTAMLELSEQADRLKELSLSLQQQIDRFTN
ncbi:methyl-accepting chemotaxis protein [Cohnella endophytica]|nr:HAMP domain-containing methyl-accepting chemotaxis protein [Cohnella endophytica]